MPRDRLPEYRQKAKISDPGEKGADASTPLLSTSTPDADVELGISMAHNNDLNRLLNQIANVKKLITYLQANVEHVKSLHNQILSEPNPDDRIKSELDDVKRTIKTSSDVISTKLKDMKTQADQDVQQKNTPDGKERIRQTHYSALLQTFKDAMVNYQLAQVEYRDGCKSRIMRQLEITNSRFSEEDVDEMIEKGSFTVFTQGIITETAKAKRMLADVEDRHGEILKLEKSLLEIHGLFLEMATLVAEQGETVTNIEESVGKTAQYVKDSNKLLLKAASIQVKTRKKKIYIAILLCVLALLLGFIIWGALR